MVLVTYLVLNFDDHLWANKKGREKGICFEEQMTMFCIFYNCSYKPKWMGWKKWFKVFFFLVLKLLHVLGFLPCGFVSFWMRCCERCETRLLLRVWYYMDWKVEIFMLFR